MKPKILVTDSLFIFDEHVRLLEDSGYEVERLNKPKASEEELVEAIKGKTGYIIGGIELVTDRVILSADKLKAIVFTGADWSGFIPGHPIATRKGIAISNTPGTNTFAVAEYTTMLILMMLRHVLEIGSTGDKTFWTGRSINEVRVGIIGMGRIGSQVARMLKGLGANDIVYWNRHRKADIEQALGLTYVSLEELISSSDVITNHVSSSAGQLVGKELLNKTKDGVIIVNAGAHSSIDLDALYILLKAGKARAAFDLAVPPRFKDLPLSTLFASNENAGFNTHTANKLASDMAVDSLVNLLKTGDDQNLVNPEYKENKAGQIATTQ